MKKLFFITISILLIISCSEGESKNNIPEENIQLPSVTTIEISNITSNSFDTGCIVTSDGGTSLGGGRIICKGLCWGTKANPTIDLITKVENYDWVFVTNNGSTGSIGNILMVGVRELTPNTTYYVRAFATNSAGTSYGNEFTVTTTVIPFNIPGPTIADIDGNIYESVSNCNKIWTKKNLNVSKYSDGTPIPQVTDPTQWATLQTGAWCYYNNDPANGAVYGKLYNWFAVVGIHDIASISDTSLRKKLAPQGWHIPSDGEWTALTNCFGGFGLGDVGGKLKSTGTALWQAPNTGATNESGFTGVPGGSRSINGVWNFNIGAKGIWWSNTSSTGYNAAWTYSMSYNANSVTRFDDRMKFGFSVRCVKD